MIPFAFSESYWLVSPWLCVGGIHEFLSMLWFLTVLLWFSDLSFLAWGLSFELLHLSHTQRSSICKFLVQTQEHCTRRLFPSTGSLETPGVWPGVLCHYPSPITSLLLSFACISLLCSELYFPNVEVGFYFYYRVGKISWDHEGFLYVLKELSVSTTSRFCPCPALLWAFPSYHGEGKIKSSKNRGQDSFGCTVCSVPSGKDWGRIRGKANSKGIVLTGHPALLYHRSWEAWFSFLGDYIKLQTKHYTPRV